MTDPPIPKIRLSLAPGRRMRIGRMGGLLAVVREELMRLLRTPVRAILEDWEQEGPDDPAEDELLLGEALATLQQYGDKPEARMSWEDFEVELDRAETAGELPEGTARQAQHLSHLAGKALAHRL